MVSPAVSDRPTTGAGAKTRLEDMYQVILHNDDKNTVEHVVRCLMRVFGHNGPLAVKIMMEAHERGKAVAEVEAESEAKRHRDQLQSFGLSATVEKI
jgi:ATP-dependent Clp protease adaptor protein ClpS